MRYIGIIFFTLLLLSSFSTNASITPMPTIAGSSFDLAQANNREKQMQRREYRRHLQHPHPQTPVAPAAPKFPQINKKKQQNEVQKTIEENKKEEKSEEKVKKDIKSKMLERVRKKERMELRGKAKEPEEEKRFLDEGKEKSIEERRSKYLNRPEVIRHKCKSSLDEKKCLKEHGLE